jgi:hypothetical protein
VRARLCYAVHVDQAADERRHSQEGAAGSGKLSQRALLSDMYYSTVSACRFKSRSDHDTMSPAFQCMPNAYCHHVCAHAALKCHLRMQVLSCVSLAARCPFLLFLYAQDELLLLPEGMQSEHMCHKIEGLLATQQEQQKRGGKPISLRAALLQMNGW